MGLHNQPFSLFVGPEVMARLVLARIFRFQGVAFQCHSAGRSPIPGGQPSLYTPSPRKQIDIEPVGDISADRDGNIDS